jgi:hypothetical protein
LPSATIGDQHNNNNNNNNWWELGMADEVLDEVALYYLGQTWHQSADVAEVLDAMHRTNSSDPSSWTTEFRKLAERMIALASESEDAGMYVSIYYRNYCVGVLVPTWRKTVS